MEPSPQKSASKWNRASKWSEEHGAPLGCVGCFTVVFVIVIIGVLISYFSGENPLQDSLRASVEFTGTQFMITNNDDFDWSNVTFTINPGYLGGGFSLWVSRVRSGQTYSVGAMQFTKGDGTRLNPFTTKPQKISISCDEGSWGGGWK